MVEKRIKRNILSLLIGIVGLGVIGILSFMAILEAVINL